MKIHHLTSLIKLQKTHYGLGCLIFIRFYSPMVFQTKYHIKSIIKSVFQVNNVFCYDIHKSVSAEGSIETKM